MIIESDGSTGLRVASQKNHPVARELARLAPPYTFATGRDPYNIKGLRGVLNVLCVAFYLEIVPHTPRFAHLSCDHIKFLAPRPALVTRSGVSRKSVSQIQKGLTIKPGPEARTRGARSLISCTAVLQSGSRSVR